MDMRNHWLQWRAGNHISIKRAIYTFLLEFPDFFFQSLKESQVQLVICEELGIWEIQWWLSIGWVLDGGLKFTLL